MNNVSMKGVNKLTKLEAIRGFAAVYVAIGHTVKKSFFIGGINISYLFRFGQEAVILFFILSGFVIQYSFEKGNNKSFNLFFTKRFLRIYIPLILVFLVNYWVLYLNHSLARVSWSDLAGNLLMLQDYGRVKPRTLVSPFLGNSPLWSLSYEWWFYLIFFFLYTRFGQSSGRYAYNLSFIATLSYFIYPTFFGRVLMYLAIWWIGADIAKLYLQNKAITFKNLLIPITCILCCTIILGLNAYFNASKIASLLHDSGPGVSPILELRHFLFALFIVPIAILWRENSWLGFNMIFGIFERIAPISYCIYISHWFLVAEAHYLDSLVDNRLIKLVIYVFICIGFSYIVELKIYPYINKIVLNRFFKKPKLETVA